MISTSAIRNAWRWCLLAPFFLLPLLVPLSGALADPALIVIDDDFGDWSSVSVAHSDPGGDAGGSQIDFGRLWIADDPRFLFLRIEVGIEIDPSENNDLRLYLDTDANSGTGLLVAGIGAELEWRFGSRSGTFFAAGQTTVFHDDIRFRAAPAVTTTEIEIAIGRDTLPDGVTPLFSGSQVRVAFLDSSGSDRVPDLGGVIAYDLDQGQLPDDPDRTLARFDPGHLRMITYNVLNDAPWNPSLEPRFGRQLAAVAPDILSFQEIRNHSAAETLTLVSNWVPLGPGESWYSAENSDCKTVSRFPILGSWPLDGNLAVLIDTTAILGSELLLINAHLPCCGNDSGRQAECDRIMAFIRDAKDNGGVLTLQPDTPIMITGDLNLVGLAGQLNTLLSGDIVGGGFGLDFDPDWDGSSLTSVISRQTEKRMGYTWRSDSSSFWPGHLDYHIYSDSVLTRENHFILYTPEIANPSSLGLQPLDSTASDHFLFCVDFAAPSNSDPVLMTIPPSGEVLDFGAVRVSDNQQATLRALNGGGSGSSLFGSFPAASSAFSPLTMQAFGPVPSGGFVDRIYVFSPSSRGAYSLPLVVTSDGGSSSLTLAGLSVGPVFASNRNPGHLIRVGSNVDDAAMLEVMNISIDEDGGNAALTDLTLRSLDIRGPEAQRFSVSGFSSGMVVGKGSSVTLRLLYLPPFRIPKSSGPGSQSRVSTTPGRFFSVARSGATLFLSTDEGTTPGGSGTEYSFPLRGEAH